MDNVVSQVSPLRQFLLYSNSHIPLLALVLIGSTSIVLQIKFSLALALVSGAGAFVIYQIDRVWLSSPEDQVNQPERVRWCQSHPYYTYLSLGFGLLTGVIFVFFLRPTTLLLGCILGLMGLLYLLPHGDHLIRLKGHWLAKPICIAICWGYGIVILPVVESGGNISGMVWTFFIYRSLLISANVLLADLPDRKGDADAKLSTLAVLASRKTLVLYVLGLSLLTLITGLSFGVIYKWPAILFIDLGGAVLMMGLSIKALQKNVSQSHFLLGYINDLIVGWPLISIAAYYFVNQI